MNNRSLVVLAMLIGALGVGLRAAIPVTPVDESFRGVIHFYETLKLPPR